LELSWQLAGCRSLRQAEAVVGPWLLAEIGGDYCGYNAVHVARRPVAVVRLYPAPADAMASSLGPALTRHLNERDGGDHPIVRHYLDHSYVAPIRLSDLLSDRQLAGTRAYAEVLGLIGARRQLALPTVLGRSELFGYAVTRAGTEFPDHAVDLAFAVQPLLTALHQLLPAEDMVEPEAAARAGLTAAEAEILRQLATGLTAESIARVRRVSPKTVRKQLDNVYRKLGIHDRLLVVAYARHVGLLKPAQEVH
jgi:DNA-binding CsgD family transcriptional regulator